MLTASTLAKQTSARLADVAKLFALSKLSAQHSSAAAASGDLFKSVLTMLDPEVALLDQKLVAGIGNLYASEILHEAHISPLRPATKLTRDQVQRLHAATQRVLLDAIKHEGSTLGDGTYRNALNQSGGYQNAHRVYAREADQCPTCGRGKVVRIIQAKRSTFFCRCCQR